jgi:hypothetical protein
VLTFRRLKHRPQPDYFHIARWLTSATDDQIASALEMVPATALRRLEFTAQAVEMDRSFANHPSDCTDRDCSICNMKAVAS